MFFVDGLLLILDGNFEGGVRTVEQTLLLDLLKAFDLIESSHKSQFSSPKRPIFPICAQHILSYHLI